MVVGVRSQRLLRQHHLGRSRHAPVCTSGMCGGGGVGRESGAMQHDGHCSLQRPFVTRQEGPRVTPWPNQASNAGTTRKCIVYWRTLKTAICSQLCGAARIAGCSARPCVSASPGTTQRRRIQPAGLMYINPSQWRICRHCPGPRWLAPRPRLADLRELPGGW